MCSHLDNHREAFQSQKSFCISQRCKHGGIMSSMFLNNYQCSWFGHSSLFFLLKWPVGYQAQSLSRMSGCSCQNCSPMMSQWWSCTLLLLRVTGTSFSWSSLGSLRRLVTVSSCWTKRMKRVNKELKDKKQTNKQKPQTSQCPTSVIRAQKNI